MVRIARSNIAYASEIAADFDFYFGAAEPTDEDGREVVDMSHARDHHVSGFPHFPIHCPSLVEPWSTAEQYLSLARLIPGETVIDLGAYAGLTSIAFSRAVGPDGRVVALEPDPANFRSAAINIDRHRENGGSPIHLLEAAASGQCGTLPVTCEGTMGSAPTSVTGRARGFVRHVRSMTLEEVAARLPPVDLVKMDIEGAEESVLTSSGNFLSRQRPRLVIEPHVVDGSLNTDRVCAVLRRLGYRTNLIDQVGAVQKLIVAEPSEPRATRARSL